jgi:hypothetical protein
VADNSIGFTAAYDDVDSAVADLEALAKLRDDKVVGSYDAAVVELENGKPHIVKRVDNPPTGRRHAQGCVAGERSRSIGTAK